MTLYPDDCKLLGLVQDDINQTNRQEDLNQQSKRSLDCFLWFNALKWKVRHLGRNNPKRQCHLVELT